MKPSLCKPEQANGSALFKIALVQLLVRLLWVVPLFIPVFVPVRLLWGIIFGFFAVLPLRFRAACQLRGAVGKTKVRPASYKSRVGGGALRFLLGGIWSIPLIGMVYLVYRYVFVLDASRYARDAARLGSLFAADAGEAQRQLIGLVLFAVVFLISFALFLYGWRRHILFEYLLTESALPIPTLSAARAAKKACGKDLLILMFSNLLTLLPACLLPLAFLCWRCGGVQNMLMTLFLLISNGMALDPVSLWLALALFMLLYLPLIPYRKGRYAALVNKYES